MDFLKYNSYISFSAEEIPVKFEVKLGNDIFVLGINHNREFNFLTVDLFDVNKNSIVLGEKLLLRQPLFEGLVDSRLPAPTIIPYDNSNIEQRATILNICKTVFLYIDDGGV